MKITALICFLSASVCFASNSDFLTQESVGYRAENINTPLEKTALDLKALFLRFKPHLDSSSKIVTPPEVFGPVNSPTLTMKIRKCVLFVCETVEVIADIRIVQVHGTCQTNLLLRADLKRSGHRLSDYYDAIDVLICFNPAGANHAHLDLSATAHQAQHYAKNPIQNFDFNLLRAQSQPMFDALKQTLQANGAELDAKLAEQTIETPQDF